MARCSFQSVRTALATAASCVCLSCGLFLAWSGDGPVVQAERPPGAKPAELVERAKVRLVLLQTSVRTRRGRPVRNLAPEDFELQEAGERREIEFFGTEEKLPVALAFLLDVSGSMDLKGQLEQSKQAIRVFVEALDPADRVGLICFADEQVAWVTDFTRDREGFLERLQVQQARGPTALYDALAASPHLVHESLKGRKAIVLLTDGLDNASCLSTLQAVWIARRVSVPIYTLSFIPTKPGSLPKRARDSLRLLDRFSKETGGIQFSIHGERDLTRAVAAIQSELRFQYVIGFEPEPPVWDGSFRQIRLRTQRDGLTVRTRAGYYAAP